MNIQLTNMLSDVVGENGQKILRAIVAGERDGQVLVAMKNVRVRASADEIAKSPQGNWRTEHLFALKQALDAFDFVGTQLSQGDQQIELQLQRLQVHDGEPAKGKKCDRAPNAPKFDLRMGTSVVDVSMPFDRNRRFRRHGPLLQKASPSIHKGTSPGRVRIAAQSPLATGLRAFAVGTAYLIPTTIESGPTRCSTRVDANPASYIQPEQSLPV